MEFNRRILIVDDDESLRFILSKFLSHSGMRSKAGEVISSAISEISGQPPVEKAGQILDAPYDVDTAPQGEIGYEKVRQAFETGRPYALMFVDMRMPPGWDGLKTMDMVWKADPKIQVVLLTAYSDYSWQQMVGTIGKRDNFIILKKPFDIAEISQVALALTQKYNLERETEERMAKLRLAEEELRLAQAHLENIFQAIPSMLLSVTSDGIVRHFNSSAGSFIRKLNPGRAAAGSKFWELIPVLGGEFRSDFESILRPHLYHKVRRIETEGSENKFLDVSMFPLSSDGAGDGIVIRIDDVTEAVRKDEHIRQMQKMETVGNLAIGIAHDFKNVIGAIRSTTDSINYSLENTTQGKQLAPVIKSDLEIIEESVLRGQDMIKQLMSISNHQELPMTDSDLNVLAQNVLRICRNIFPESIEFKTKYYETPAVARVYPVQIEQVLLNLCVNACHAMTTMRPPEEWQGGSLILTVDKIYVGENMVEYIPEASIGYYWILRVGDTGVGMDKETLKKIYDPFFTTKKEGSGLGLTMVYNIIKQHRGFIDVFSEPGNGTTFFIFIPSPS